MDMNKMKVMTVQSVTVETDRNKIETAAEYIHFEHTIKLGRIFKDEFAVN